MKRRMIWATTREPPVMAPPTNPDTPILQNIETEKYL